MTNEKGPGMIGPSASPVPTKEEAERVWRDAYVARMVERGVDPEGARMAGDAVEVDLSFAPSDAREHTKLLRSFLAESRR